MLITTPCLSYHANDIMDVLSANISCNMSDENIQAPVEETQECPETLEEDAEESIEEVE